MKKLKLWASLVLVLVVLAGGFYAWWSLDGRWRPETIDRDKEAIAEILEKAGWVSPGGEGPKLYMVSYRDCPDCVRYELEEFPKLHKAGVDTRVIVVARPDQDGVIRTTAAERATIAELWVNRDWKLLQAWLAIPSEGWTAPDVKPSDGDAARSAVVELSKATVKELTPLLRKNGIDFAYPLLIWWDKDGTMRGCACEKAQTYRFVRKELGA